MNWVFYILYEFFAQIETKIKTKVIEFNIIYAKDSDHILCENTGRNSSILFNQYGFRSEENNILKICKGVHFFSRHQFICPNRNGNKKHFKLTTIMISFPNNICLKPSPNRLFLISKVPKRIYLHQNLYSIDFKYCLKTFSEFDYMIANLTIYKFLDLIYFSFIIDIYKDKNFYKVLKSYMIHIPGNILYHGINQVILYKERFDSTYFEWIISRMLDAYFEVNFFCVKNRKNLKGIFDKKAIEEDQKLKITGKILKKMHDYILRGNEWTKLYFLFHFKNITSIYLNDLHLVDTKKIFCFNKLFSNPIYSIVIGYTDKIGLILLNLRRIKVFKEIKKLEIQNSFLTENNLRLLDRFTALEHFVLLDISIKHKNLFFPKYLSGKLINLKVLDISVSSMNLNTNFCEIFTGLQSLYISVKKTNDYRTFENLIFPSKYYLLLRKISICFTNVSLMNFFNTIANFKKLEDITLKSQNSTPSFSFLPICIPKYNSILKKLHLDNLYLGYYEFLRIYNFQNLKSLSFKNCTFSFINYIYFSSIKFANKLENLTIENCDNAYDIFLTIQLYKNLKILNIESSVWAGFANSFVIKNLNLHTIFFKCRDLSKIPIKIEGKNSKLKILEFSFCNFSANSLHLLELNVDYLKNIKYFTYSDNYLSPNDINCISNMYNCELLDISRCEFQNCHFHDIFLPNKVYKIKELYIYDLNLNKKDLIALRNLNFLLHLSISFCSIDRSSLYYLKKQYLK
ncbi:hypothetical protein CWI39_2088p0010, partial [Hamiltosporidium magnivora]